MNNQRSGMFYHDPEKTETISVLLTESKFPIAYAAKLKELKKAGMTEEDAKKLIDTSPIELEIYYSPDLGLFAVEAEAIEGGAELADPYTHERMVDLSEAEAIEEYLIQNVVDSDGKIGGFSYCKIPDNHLLKTTASVDHITFRYTYTSSGSVWYFNIEIL